MSNQAIKPTKLLIISWLLILPAGIYIAYRFFPSVPMNPLLILVFLVLVGVVAYFPIIINDTPIFLVQWVTLVAFLLHGLIYEIIFYAIFHPYADVFIKDRKR